MTHAEMGRTSRGIRPVVTGPDITGSAGNSPWVRSLTTFFHEAATALLYSSTAFSNHYPLYLFGCNTRKHPVEGAWRNRTDHPHCHQPIAIEDQGAGQGTWRNIG